MRTPRQALSKKTRFEVLKRDRFTCQYCGAKAADTLLSVAELETPDAAADPDAAVRLHVDHIIPRALGGADHVANYVTACEACNLGKGARRLDDQSAVRLQHDEIDRRAAHLEQLALQAAYHREVIERAQTEESVAVAAFNDAISEHGRILSPTGEKSVRRVVRKYGLDATLDAVRIAASQYLDRPRVEPDDAIDLALRKLGGICHVRRIEAADPAKAELYRIRGLLINGVSGRVDPVESLGLLEEAQELGWDLAWVRRFAAAARSYWGWRDDMRQMIAEDRRTTACVAAAV
jgi:5-methylcytosine-specific restriction endonuclease McrA